MNFIFNSFFIALKCVKRKILLLLLILTMAGFLCQAIVIFAQNSLNRENFRLNVAVVNLDDSEQMDFLLNLALKNNAIEDLFDVQVVSAKDGEILLRNNEIIACVTLPTGFLQSVLSSENISPDIAINQTNTLEKYLILDIIDSFVNLLNVTQCGVYTTFDNLSQNKIPTSDLVLDVNLDYIRIVADYDDFFDYQPINYTKTLDISTHYLTCTAFFLILLTFPLFFEELNINYNVKIFRFIASYTSKYQFFYFLRILVIVLVYFLVFLCTMLSLEANFSFPFVIFILNSAFFTVLLNAIILNFSSKYIPTLMINFTLFTLCLIISGGIVPSVFLPSFLSNMDIFSPITILQTTMLSGFSSIDYNFLYNAVILALNIAFTLILSKLIRKTVGE